MPKPRTTLIRHPARHPPHVGDEKDVPQARITAKFAEHLGVASRNPRDFLVGNAVHVNNPSEL